MCGVWDVGECEAVQLFDQQQLHHPRSLHEVLLAIRVLCFAGYSLVTDKRATAVTWGLVYERRRHSIETHAVAQQLLLALVLCTGAATVTPGPTATTQLHAHTQPSTYGSSQQVPHFVRSKAHDGPVQLLQQAPFRKGTIVQPVGARLERQR